MPDPRVIVVGTTADYVEHIRGRYPGEALFITDAGERKRATEPRPGPREELVYDLGHTQGIIPALQAHLKKWEIDPTGVTCYDCESLGLAASLARTLGLSFPTSASVSACRNKFRAKRLWQEAGVPCPETALVRSGADAFRFMDRVRQPIILKPLTGSGSELVFRCTDHAGCAEAVAEIQARLATHQNARMYRSESDGASEEDPRREFAAETFISGPEYSCDFIIGDDQIRIIRIARKIPDPAGPVGTTLAYVVPSALPEGISVPALEKQLGQAALALGIGRAICMADFIVNNGRACLLEITPRPGGDCLPWLILRSCGLDMLKLALDFARHLPVTVPEPSQWEQLAGLRLFARQAGRIRRADDGLLKQDPRVREIFLRFRPGHRVVLPPADYDSRLLGHVIFRPASSRQVEAECADMASKFKTEIEI